MFEYRQPKPYFKNLSAPKGKQDFSRYVSYLHTHKSLDQSAGTWEIQLTPVPDAEFDTNPSTITADNFESAIYRLFRPMDVVLVGMNDETIMLGFVDNVYKTKQQRGDSVSRKISIRGRDGMKIFHEDSVANAPELATQSKVKALLGSATTQFLNWIRGLMSDGKTNIFANSTIPEAIWWILQNTPSMNIQLDGGQNNKTASELFLTSIASYKDDKLFDEQLSVYSGKIINYMAQVLDPAFYEIWVDTIPKSRTAGKEDKPCLFIRPRPFDHNSADPYEVNTESVAPVDLSGITIDSEAAYLETENSASDHWLNNPVPIKDQQITSWEDLSCPVYGKPTEIEEREIISKNLGVSDFDVSTMYKCTAAKDPLAVSELGKYGMYFPLIDGMMVRYFGIREMQAQSKMLPPMAHWYEENKPTTVSGDILYDAIATNIWLLKKESQRKSKKDVVKSVVQKRDRLWRWNRYNHLMESGQITIGGRDTRVGSKVILKEESGRGVVSNGQRSGGFSPMEYYCISVDQSYTFATNWVTALGLTRGQNKTEREEYSQIRGFDKPKENGIFTAEYQ